MLTHQVLYQLSHLPGNSSGFSVTPEYSIDIPLETNNISIFISLFSKLLFFTTAQSSTSFILYIKVLRSDMHDPWSQSVDFDI